jgi:serine/threonine protein kinase
MVTSDFIRWSTMDPYMGGSLDEPSQNIKGIRFQVQQPLHEDISLEFMANASPPSVTESLTQTETVEEMSLQSVRCLGQGGFGTVDEVKFRASCQVYARKTIYHSKHGHNYSSSLIHLDNEIKALSRLKHPHIVRLVGYYETLGRSTILLSPVADCNLDTVLTAGLHIVNKYVLVLEWMRSLASALAYMHSNEVQVRHRDIKPANILVKDGKVYLSDFGSSVTNRLQNQSPEMPPLFGHHERQVPSLGSCQFAVTSKYCAPEVITTGVSGRASDIFSLGCVFTEMLTVVCGEPVRKLEEYRSKGQKEVPFRSSLGNTTEWLTHLKFVKSDQDMTRYWGDIFETVVMMLPAAPNERLSAKSVEERLSQTRNKNPGE